MTSPAQRLRTGLVYALLVGYGLTVLYPIFLMLLSSFKTGREILRDPFALPARWSFENYVRAWTEGNFSSYFGNSVFVTLSALVIVLALGSLAAYPLGRYAFRGKNLLMIYFLAGLMLPVRLGILPLFFLMRDLGLYNTPFALILLQDAALRAVQLLRRAPEQLGAAVRGPHHHRPAAAGALFVREQADHRGAHLGSAQVASRRAMHPLLRETAHRPYALPARPWALHMRWLELLFLHWPLQAEALRPHIPSGLKLETHSGSAWLGVVPFVMSEVYPRGTFSVPGLSRFPELNVRTYVTREGKPGVWFFSLDAASKLAVRLARRGFHLPYFDARMRCRKEGETVRYESVRSHRGAPEASFVGSYRPLESPEPARPGSLEHFLSERYCLYSAAPNGQVYRGDVHHRPWPLQRAEAEIRVNTMGAQLGLAGLEAAPLLHFARDLEVLAWGPVAVG